MSEPVVVAHASQADLDAAGRNGIFFRGTRDLILVEGADTVTYLQGQVSADIASLTPGASTRSLLLSPQGKLVAWLRCTRLANDVVLLDVAAGVGNSVCERLNRFKLRVAVTLSLQESVSSLFVRGAAARAKLAAELGTLGVGSTYVVDATWADHAGIDVLSLDDESLERFAKQSEANEVDATVFEALRVSVWREPRWGSEVVDDMIPAEAGLVESSVSFTKGCYTGQELTARLDSRGSRTARVLVAAVANVPKVVTQIDDVVWTVDDDEAGARDAGVITSAAQIDAQLICLGYAKRAVLAPRAADDETDAVPDATDSVLPDVVLQVKTPAGPVSVTVVRA